VKTSSVDNANPAGRLHQILSRAQTTINTSGQRGEAGNLWAAVFEIPVSGVPLAGPAVREVISRILQLDKLIAETEASLMEIEGLPDRYFRPFARIRNIPLQSLGALNTDISGTIRSITEGDMTVLEFCSERLEERHTESVVNEEELTEILQEVSTLFDDVRQSNLDSELQTFILDGLESIRRGIFEYRIRGPQRLKEVLAEIIGSLAMNRDIVRAAGDDETVGRFEKAFYRLAAAVSFASDSIGLLTAVKVALLPGG